MGAAEGGNGLANGHRAVKRTCLTTDVVEMHDTTVIMPIITFHPLAEVHQTVTFPKSFFESALITLIVAEMEIHMVIRKGGNILKDSNKVVTARKAPQEIACEHDRMLD